MNRIYDRMLSIRTYSEFERNWNGNDRCYIADEGDKYAFCFAPKSLADGMITASNTKVLKRTLLYIRPMVTDIQRTMGPDFIAQPNLKITIPYGHYGVILSATCDFELNASTVLGIHHGDGSSPLWTMSGNRAVLNDGIYTAMVITDGKLFFTDRGIMIKVDGNGHTVISYGLSYAFANDCAEKMFHEYAEVSQESIDFWNAYFESCPVVESKGEACLLRQYWHWWCALINVSNIAFNAFPMYMSPDRGSGWYGTWSNDGPETMAALSLTNQRAIAKELIVRYIEAAISDTGIHSWYLHSDGNGCFGRQGDVGRLSQGVPNIIHTVAFYIRNTGDVSILEERVNNTTVYEKIKTYFHTLFEMRDWDYDGLIEWRNLWETGWDDKLGCFFKKASLNEWMYMAVQYNEEETTAFYKENSYPVVAVVEQVYLRWAITAMKQLAGLQNDRAVVSFCEGMESLTSQSFEHKCWNEEDGFYYDYNVRENCQIKSKSADCFYALYFETNPKRIKRIVEKLYDKNAFAARYIPMQSMDCHGFSSTGYWSGGHWPREMSYLSMGLCKAGEKQLAEEILLKAIMSGENDCLYEVMNPIEGVPTSGVTKMAYDVLEVVALLCIEGKVHWQ